MACSLRSLHRSARVAILISNLLSWSASFAQTTPKEPQFTSPLNIPLSLSGNFMELRSDHFHSGLDMRTEGREGLDVKAAGDGWVSRIKVSPWGYGKALYIDHPEGYSTVYGHLSAYMGVIADTLLARQYQARSFEVDLEFSRNALPVKKNQVVALSGNTGGSGGPHLHFEVRRTGDQHALDPERYGMNVPDDVAPIFSGLRIDALDSAARVQPYPGGARGFVVAASGNSYTLKDGTVPEALGTVGFAVNVIDRYTNSSSTCGIRSLKVSVDGAPVFSASLDEVDFGLNRYANAYMDYALFKDNDMHYNRCYKLPNNKLGIYGRETAQGRITITAGEEKKILVEAVDPNGNRSELRFTLRGAAPEKAAAWAMPASPGQLFRHDRENTIANASARFTLPANALYADERVRLRTDTATGRTVATRYAPLTRLHERLTPLQLPGQLALKADVARAAKHADKLLIVRVDDKGKISPVGGTLSADGWITAKVKAFGDYTVMLDTLPPKVTAIGLKPVMTGRNSLIIQVGDDLSGVDQWKGELDGRWILFEHDPKKKMLIHHFDRYSDKPGEHELRVEVRDERGNTGTLTAKFTR